MEKRTGSLTFASSEGSGPRTANRVFNFTSPVSQAIAILTGKSFGFSEEDGDHHVGRITTRLETSIDDDVVTVNGIFGVRDWSNEWDDRYEGSMQFVLLAELDTTALLSNLSITGIEFNQATQFFRSQLHLDPASAGADNSIPLIAGKDLVARVFVDTGDDPARPSIGQVTGELQIRSGGGTWNAIAPLNGPIDPIRDEDIRRNNADATLNFLIPGAFAQDQLEVRVRAFDSVVGNRPDLGVASGMFEETLQFRSVEPLRVRGVLVNYTGTPAVAAPTINDLRNTLDYVEGTYPVHDVIITGVDIINDNGDYTDMSGDGCGTGWGGLLDTLREMQGDSSDVYYGLLGSGVPLGWGGCGGGGVGAGPVGAGSTAAQEIGHAFDRDHAPCGNAGDPDPNYPVYGTLPMGSIGEHGIDAAGDVKDPVTDTDFMGYCGNKWVSPYTYLGLMNAIPSTESSLSPIAAFNTNLNRLDTERPTQISEQLFVNLEIRGRNLKVIAAPMFHYKAKPVLPRGRPTQYRVELRDCHDTALVSRQLHRLDPHGRENNAIFSFFEAVAWPKGVARLVVLCDEGGCSNKELHIIDVPPEAPRIEKVAVDATQDKVHIAWTSAKPEDCLWYLVQYSHNGGATWRNVTSRTQDTSVSISRQSLAGGKQCIFRVLATSGVRTGYATSDSIPLSNQEPIVTIRGGDVSVHRGDIVMLSTFAFSADSGSLPSSGTTWISDRDGVVGHGRRLRFRARSLGVHQLTANVPDGAGGYCTVRTKLTVNPRKVHSEYHHHDDNNDEDNQTGKVK
jgi:hypothetical protein